jgi:hypothetical protein
LQRISDRLKPDARGCSKEEVGKLQAVGQRCDEREQQSNDTKQNDWKQFVTAQPRDESGKPFHVNDPDLAIVGRAFE